MIFEAIVGLAISVSITASAIADLTAQDGTAMASAISFLVVGALVFIQYLFAASSLNLAQFYRFSGIRAREEQRAAGLFIVLLLVALYASGAYFINYTPENANRNEMVGWRLIQTAYFGTLWFYLPAIRSKSRVGIIVVTSLGAIEQIMAMILVAIAAHAGNAYFPTWLVAIQILASLWATGYDFLLYNDFLCSFSCCCCSSAFHVGPRFETQGISTV